MIVHALDCAMRTTGDSGVGERGPRIREKVLSVQNSVGRTAAVTAGHKVVFETHQPAAVVVFLSKF